jgi:hypothetical protein
MKEKKHSDNIECNTYSYLFMLIFFAFFVFQFLLPFPIFSVWFFIAVPCFPLPFHLCFVSVFQLLWVSSLAYPNMVETKMFDCCCCCDNIV